MDVFFSSFLRDHRARESEKERERAPTRRSVDCVEPRGNDGVVILMGRFIFLRRKKHRSRRWYDKTFDMKIDGILIDAASNVGTLVYLLSKQHLELPYMYYERGS